MNNDIRNDFNNSTLKEYIDEVLNNQPLKDTISKLSYKIKVFNLDGDMHEIHAIDKAKVDYIVLVTKLTTMVDVFKQLKQDDNIVMVDTMLKELNRFQDVISKSIEQTNKELIDN